MCVLLKKIEKKMRFLYATKDCLSSSHYMVINIYLKNIINKKIILGLNYLIILKHI